MTDYSHLTETEDADVFLEQNVSFAVNLTEEDVEQVDMYAEPHAGGLFVLLRDLGDGWYVKVHDDWGPGDEPGGPVVVDIYDANDSEAEGWEERQSFHSDGHEALIAFFDAVAPAKAV